MTTEYVGFALVTVIAVLAPLLREMVPWILVPSIVLELLGGLALGPEGLGWLSADDPAIHVFADIGLAALLFMAGSEIALDKMRGAIARGAVANFAMSLALAIAAGLVLQLTGMVIKGLLVAITLVACSLSVILGPLKDARQTATPFGQRVIAAASLGEIGAIVMLSLFYSGQSQPGESQLQHFAPVVIHLALFAVLALAIAGSMTRGLRMRPVRAALARLRGTTAHIRVRIEFAYLAGAIALGGVLGIESILAAFTVGVLHRLFNPPSQARAGRERWERISFGLFVPFFFVKSGVDFDIAALTSTPARLALVPLFLLGLLLVHGIPAYVLRGRAGVRSALASGLLLATSLSFIVVATQVGLQLGIMRPATAAALIGAGMLSIIAFPAIALALLREAPGEATLEAEAPEVEPTSSA